MEPYREFYTYTNEGLAIPGSGGVQGVTNIDTDSDFTVVKRCATAVDRRVWLQQTETSTGRNLSNAPLALAAAFGNGRHPFTLPVSKVLKLGSQLSTLYVDYSTILNQVRCAFHGYKTFASPPWPLSLYRAREEFTYAVNFVNPLVDPSGLGVIAAGGTGGPFGVRIQTDADWELDKIAIVHDLAIPAGLDSLATLELKDESYGRRFSDRPVPIENYGATRDLDPEPAGFFPFVLPATRLLRAGSLLSVTVRNLDPANALSIRLMFAGQKLYTATRPSAA